MSVPSKDSRLKTCLVLLIQQYHCNSTTNNHTMDFEDELDEEAAAMAAAMGFSTFGSHKPPAKKRKFNPASDAFVSGQELENIDRGGKKGQGSGGNTMPLGKMREFGVGKKIEKANEDEINIDDDEEETVQPVATRRAMNLPAVSSSGTNRTKQADAATTERINQGQLPVRQAGGNEDEIDLDDEDVEEGGAKIIRPAGEDGPAYLDTSHTPPADVVPALDSSDPEAIEMQARIDAILASIEESQASQEQPVPNTEPPPSNSPEQQAFNRTGHGGRGRGLSDTASVASSRPSHGGRNPRWFEDYYDPNFNENPWKKLEAEKGLESVGTWLEPSNDRFRRS